MRNRTEYQKTLLGWMQNYYDVKNQQDGLFKLNCNRTRPSEAIYMNYPLWLDEFNSQYIVWDSIERSMEMDDGLNHIDSPEKAIEQREWIEAQGTCRYISIADVVVLHEGTVGVAILIVDNLNDASLEIDYVEMVRIENEKECKISEYTEVYLIQIGTIEKLLRDYQGEVPPMEVFRSSFAVGPNTFDRRRRQPHFQVVPIKENQEWDKHRIPGSEKIKQEIWNHVNWFCRNEGVDQRNSFNALYRAVSLRYKEKHDKRPVGRIGINRFLQDELLYLAFKEISDEYTQTQEKPIDSGEDTNKIGFVYFFKVDAGDKQYVKIGFSNTKRGVKSRRKSIQTGNPLIVQELLVLPGTGVGYSSDEYRLHREFEDYPAPARNEWFDLSEPIVQDKINFLLSVGNLKEFWET